VVTNLHNIFTRGADCHQSNHYARNIKCNSHLNFVPQPSTKEGLQVPVIKRPAKRT